jgi:hypothetical protein
MTRSRCSDASSGLLIRTFLRRRKSLAGSLPAMIGVLPSLETDAAREVEALESKGLGVGAFETGVEVVAIVKEGLEGRSIVLLFRLMMFVSSPLKFSRSV